MHSKTTCAQCASLPLAPPPPPKRQKLPRLTPTPKEQLCAHCNIFKRSAVKRIPTSFFSIEIEKPNQYSQPTFTMSKKLSSTSSTGRELKPTEREKVQLCVTSNSNSVNSVLNHSDSLTLHVETESSNTKALFRWLVGKFVVNENENDEKENEKENENDFVNAEEKKPEWLSTQPTPSPPPSPTPPAPQPQQSSSGNFQMGSFFSYDPLSNQLTGGLYPTQMTFFNSSSGSESAGGGRESIDGGEVPVEGEKVLLSALDEREIGALKKKVGCGGEGDHSLANVILDLLLLNSSSGEGGEFPKALRGITVRK